MDSTITKLLLFIFLSFVFEMNAQILEWARSMGSANLEYGKSITVDSDGNVYTTGIFRGTTDFDPGPGTFELTPVGGNDIFIQKLDAEGNFIWTKSIGGVENDAVGSIEVDNLGNIYVTGFYQETVDFDPGAGTTEHTSNGNGDIFVLKLNASGNYVWSGSMGGPLLDYGAAIALDGNGNTLITGSFVGTADFDPGLGISNYTAVGQFDIFIVKLDPSGNLIWTKTMGGTDSDEGIMLRVDDQGNIFSTGYFRGSADFDPGMSTTLLTSAGDNDVYVQKLDASGNLVWVCSMGGTSTDQGNSIAIDATGNTYTTGYFQGTSDFDPGAGVYALSSEGNKDIFVQKLDSTGDFEWAMSIGSASNDLGSSITVDDNGNIYTTGSFEGSADFDPGANTFNLTSQDMTDVFIQKLDNSGNFLWALSFGGLSDHLANSIAVDTTGNIYTTGYFSVTTDFDPSAGTFEISSNGGLDAFVQKLSQCMVETETELNGITISATATEVTYQWLDCDNNYAVINGETEQSFTPTNNGNYAVEITDNGCVDTSDCVAITTVNLDEINGDIGVSIYPNPTTGLFHVKGNVVLDVVVHDAMGRAILFSKKNKEHLIDLSNQGKGVYLVQVNGLEFNQTRRIVVK